MDCEDVELIRYFYRESMARHWAVTSCDPTIPENLLRQWLVDKRIHMNTIAFITI